MLALLDVIRPTAKPDLHVRFCACVRVRVCARVCIICITISRGYVEHALHAQALYGGILITTVTWFCCCSCVNQTVHFGEDTYIPGNLSDAPSHALAKPLTSRSSTSKPNAPPVSTPGTGLNGPSIPIPSEQFKSLAPAASCPSVELTSVKALSGGETLVSPQSLSPPRIDHTNHAKSILEVETPNRQPSQQARTRAPLNKRRKKLTTWKTELLHWALVECPTITTAAELIDARLRYEDEVKANSTFHSVLLLLCLGLDEINLTVLHCVLFAPRILCIGIKGTKTANFRKVPQYMVKSRDAMWEEIVEDLKSERDSDTCREAVKGAGPVAAKQIETNNLTE